MKKARFYRTFLLMERVSGYDEIHLNPFQIVKTRINPSNYALLQIEKNIFCYQKCYQKKRSGQRAQSRQAMTLMNYGQYSTNKKRSPPWE